MRSPLVNTELHRKYIILVKPGKNRFFVFSTITFPTISFF